MPFTVTTTTEITEQQVADLMVTALEGGSNYWIYRVEPQLENVAAYADATSYGPSMTARVIYAEDDDDAHQLNYGTICTGLQVMATDYPRHFADIVNDNVDADTADVFLQCVLFGEVTYG